MSPEQFEEWAGLLSEAIFLLGKDRRILAANKAVQRFDLSTDELVGRTFSELSASSEAKVFDFLKLCARSRQPVMGSLDLQGNDQRVIPCRCDGKLIPNSGGQILLKVSPKASYAEHYKLINEKIDELNQEISRRTRVESELKKQNEYLRVTLTSIGDGVIVTDAEGNVTLLNKVATELTGWSTEDANRIPLEQVFRIVNEKTGLATENPALKSLTEGTIVGLANHTILISKDGTRRPIDDSAAPIRSPGGNVLGAVLVFRDISERRQAEQKEEEQKRLLALRHEIGSALAANQDLQSALQQCVESLVKHLDMAFARIWTLNEPENMLELQASAGIYTHLDGPHSRIKLGEYKIGRIAKNREPHLTNDVLHDANISDPDWAAKAGMVSFAGYPLGIGTQVLGVIGMFAQHQLSDAVLENLAPLADGISQFIERKRSEEMLEISEARFALMADAIPQLAWIAQPDGAVTWYNNRWYEYTGLTIEQSQDWGWQVAHHPETLPKVIEAWQASIESGEHFEMVFPLKRQDGEYHPFLTRVVPFRDNIGKVVCWFGTSTDITKQKALEEELREIAAQLSEADRRKDEFLATLAHELRNPLAPIRTGLEVMKMVQDDPETLEELRATMERQAKQLVTLIDDLMDVSRITRGKFELRRGRVELSGVVQSAVEAVKPFIDEQGHQLTVSLPGEPISLHADPNRLAQVLSNLLSNAAKYTRENGQIWLTVLKAPEETVVVSVKDSGIGIPQEMQESIFEMFTQIDRSLERIHTGLGIGLTLVKSLVAMHEGTIEVHSDGPDQGSEFIVRLPIAKKGNVVAKTNASQRNSSSQRKCRVLVVDDNRAAAESLATMLKILGHEVETAHDGAEGLKLAETYRPHLVLLDLGMPRLNGFETAIRLRELDWGSDLAIVAVTGWGQKKDRERTRASGFDYHLVKPVEPDVMQDVIQSVMVDFAERDAPEEK